MSKLPRYETPELTLAFQGVTDQELLQSMRAGVDRDGVDAAYKEHVAKRRSLGYKDVSIYSHLRFYEEAASPEASRAHHELVERNTRLISHTIQRFFPIFLNDNWIETAYQEGWAALSLAAWQWQPERGELSTAAVIATRRHLNRVEAKGLYIVRVAEGRNNARKALSKFFPDLLRQAVETEETSQLADYLPRRATRNSDNLIRDIVQIESMFSDHESLDEVLGSVQYDPYTGEELENDYDVPLILVDHSLQDDQEQMGVRDEAEQFILKTFPHLDERERKAVLMRQGFIDGTTWTLEEVGREFGVSKDRARQIENRAFQKIRAILRQNHEPQEAS